MDWTVLGFRGLGEVVNIHPVFVHFPIVLFPVAWLFYFIGLVWKRERFVFAGRLLLCLAFLSAGVTVLTGEMAEGSLEHSEAVHRLIETHETLGVVVLVAGGVLALWSFWTHGGAPKMKRLFMVFLGLAALAALQNADLGGRMVFVEGAGVKAVTIESTKKHKHHEHRHEGHSHGEGDHVH